jgi:PAS domain S-box-containing protein
MNISNRGSEPDFEAIFRWVPGLYLVLEPESTIVAVSDAYLNATMTKREDILGRDLFDVFPSNPDDPHASGTRNLRASLNRVLANRVPDTLSTQRYDIRRPLEDGGGYEERYWTSLNSPVLDEQGEVIQIIHRVEDVTGLVKLRQKSVEQEKVEQTLRRSEQWLATTLGSIADAVIATDAADCILFMNPVAERLTGWRLHDARGRVLTEVLRLVSGATGEPLASPTARACRNDSPVSLPPDTVLVTRHGQQIPVEDSAAPISNSTGENDGSVIVFRDITNRRRIEGELRRKDQELTDFIENATVGLHWVGPDGTILWANRAELGMLGYSREEYVGRNIAEFHVDPRVIEDILSRLEANEELQSYEARLRCKDGSIRWVLINSNVFRDDGKFVHTKCFTRDITERKQAEVEARRQQERWRVALSSIGDAVILTDREGRVTFMNPVAEALCGWRQAEAAERPLDEVFRIVNETTRQPVDNPVEKVLATEEVVGLANYTVLIARDQGETPIDDSAAPVVDDQGQVTGVVLVFHDITSKRRAQELTERLAAVVESSDDIIVSKTLGGIITSWNKGAERILGYSAEEMIGQHVSKLLPPGQVEDVSKILGHIRRGDKVDHYETKRRRKDGAIIDVSLTVSAIRDAGGQIVGASKIGRDITAQKLLEAERQEADRRKDEFLAMLAHELRNPLASVSNAVQLFGRVNQEEELEWARDVIQRQVKHLAHLIDDLLDVSRITRGKIGLRKERLDLSPVVSSAVETVRPLLEERKHEMTVSLASGALRLEADPLRLEQILVNLLTNAAKYTDAGGRIWLSARQEQSQIVITVRDSGVGVSPELLSRMFDLFAQGDRSKARSEGGLGIGLTLVRKLAEMHGGKVTATSEGPGKGSEFVVRLPALEESPLQSRPPILHRPHVARQRSRVLVVDDNVDTARGLAKLLRLLGHEIQLAFDGPTAIQLARTHRPEVVLLDIGLPGMDGYQVVKLLRQDEWCKDSLIIAASGYGQEEDRRRSHEAGFDHHLVKPVDYDALMSLLAPADETVT